MLLTNRIRAYLSHFISRDYQPWNISSLVFPTSYSYSDIFPVLTGFANIFYVFENPSSMFSSKPAKIAHSITFLDANGKEIFVDRFESKDKITCHKLPLFEEPVHFYHSTYPILDLANTGVFDSPLLYRGYLHHYTSKDMPPFVVHGNFGGITSDGKATARQRRKYTYIPSYLFNTDSSYKLFFINPTSVRLRISVTLLSSHANSIADYLLNPLGHQILHISDYSGLISISSMLPICRPIIYVLSEENDIVDIFHS
jgi:hypothetical protein